MIETQSRESDEMLRLKELVISYPHDGIALLDSEGKYCYVNEVHVKPFEYKYEEEVVGKTWHVIYPPEEIERLEREMFPILVEHVEWTGQNLGTTKQGASVFQEILLPS